MTRDRKGQAFVPGFLTAVYHTPVITEGELPGGGGLFASCTRAAEVGPVVVVLSSLGPVAYAHRPGVIQRTDTPEGEE